MFIFVFLTSQSKAKKKEEVSDEIVEEKSVGTLATVKDVLGRTGSRGGVIQVSSFVTSKSIKQKLDLFTKSSVLIHFHLYLCSRSTCFLLTGSR